MNDNKIKTEVLEETNDCKSSEEEITEENFSIHENTPAIEDEKTISTLNENSSLNNSSLSEEETVDNASTSSSDNNCSTESTPNQALESEESIEINHLNNEDQTVEETTISADTNIEIETQTSVSVEHKADKEVIAKTNTETSTIVKPSDNVPTKPHENINNYVVIGFSSVIIVLILVLISKYLFGKSGKKQIFSQKDFDLFMLLSELNEVYKKTDDYLKKKS